MSWLLKRRSNKKTKTTTMLIITLLTVVAIISMINNIQYLFHIINVGEEDDYSNSNNNNNNNNRGLSLLLGTQPQKDDNQQQTKITAAICMIIKSQLYDLDEWIDYHLLLGFDTIYIYDNSDTYDLQLWYKSRQKQSPIYSKVQVYHHPGYRQQWSAYQKCINSNKRSTEEMDLLMYQQSSQSEQYYSMMMNPYIHDWLAFLDMDEFIVLKKHNTIQELLVDYKEYDGIALNRITYYFDPITQLTSSHAGIIPVTRKFNMRLKQPDIYVKTIAQTSQIKEPNIHFPKYKRNNFSKHVDTSKQSCTYVNEEDKKKKEIINEKQQQQQQQDTTTTNNNNNTFDRPERNPTRPEDIAVINHYETKSLEEFQSKCLRGRAASGTHPLACMTPSKIIQHFQSLTYNNNNNDGNGNGNNNNDDDGSSSSGLIFDDTAWQFLSKSLPEKYGIYN